MRNCCTLFIAIFCFQLGLSQNKAQLVSTNPTSVLASEYLANNVDLEGVNHTDFELVGGLIFVEAELNGETKNFILDTGAPGLLVNDSQIEKSKNGRKKLRGIGGSKRIKEIRNPKFKWKGNRSKRDKCFAVDLSNFERVKKREIGGMMGYDQVKNHELVIDYQAERIFLIPRSNKNFFKKYNRTEKIPFRMLGHIPIVKVKIGKKKFYFGIDTGAEVNVINSGDRKRIPKKLIAKEEESKVMGPMNHPQTVNRATIKNLKVGKTEYQNMKFVFTNLAHLSDENGFQLDGLLGYPFLKQANFSINYRKKIMCKWELKPDNLPLVFQQTK